MGIPITYDPERNLNITHRRDNPKPPMQEPFSGIPQTGYVGTPRRIIENGPITAVHQPTKVTHTATIQARDAKIESSEWQIFSMEKPMGDERHEMHACMQAMRQVAGNAHSQSPTRQFLPPPGSTIYSDGPYTVGNQVGTPFSHSPTSPPGLTQYTPYNPQCTRQSVTPFFPPDFGFPGPSIMGTGDPQSPAAPEPQPEKDATASSNTTTTTSPPPKSNQHSDNDKGSEPKVDDNQITNEPAKTESTPTVKSPAKPETADDEQNAATQPDKKEDDTDADAATRQPGATEPVKATPDSPAKEGNATAVNPPAEKTDATTTASTSTPAPAPEPLDEGGKCALLALSPRIPTTHTGQTPYARPRSGEGNAFVGR